MTTQDAPGPRIDAAKAAADRLVEQMPESTEIGLVTYGTQTGSTPAERAAGCRDVSALIGLGRLDRDRVREALAGVSASGYTPIALSLQTAVELLPQGDRPQAVVLVSDGEDTCGVPPCEVAGQLKAQRPGLAISTIGFKTGDLASDQLGCIAAVSGGVFVTADNAAQLAARLRAVRDVDDAKTALSSKGIGDIWLGMTAADIRSKQADFPAVAAGDSVVVVYRECDFSFVDGFLDSISPRDGGRTIDGVGLGDTLATAAEFYGEPLEITDNGDGTVTMVYDADPDSDIAYRITAETDSRAGGTDTGSITSITLCRCKPRSATVGQAGEPETVVIRAVDKQGNVQPGYLVTGEERSGTRFDCSLGASPFDIGTGVIQCGLPRTDWFLLSCWPTPQSNSVVCLRGHDSKDLLAIDADGVPREPAARSDQAVPLAITLEDGTDCVSTLRSGTGYPIRDDGGVPKYTCAGDPDFLGIYELPSRGMIEKTLRGWRVLVGGYSGPLAEYGVSKVYFVGVA